MPKLVDRTGLRYGRLVVIRRAPNRGRRVIWLCQCDCGNQVTVVSDSLHARRTESCGCLRKEVTARLATSHGMTGTPEYSTWQRIHQRCNNPNCPAYHLYGGRGITIDPQWNDFATFYADMGPKPDPKYSIERVNNDGPYSSENCKWATKIEQANNTRSNHFFTFGNRTMTIAQWSREIGISQRALFYRLCRARWPIERALTTPVG